MAENNSEGAPNFIELAGDITIAWLQNPNVNPAAEDVPAFLKSMHLAIAGLDEALSAEPESEAVTYEPAVPVRSSIKPDYLVSLIDGRKYKTLKRHLAANGLTPDEYRLRYGLKPDYPMVAANFAAMRREIAEKIGLGRKSIARPDVAGEAIAVPAETQEAAPPAPKEDAVPVASSVTAKSVARKPKARADKTPVASTTVSPPPAETKGKPARATRKVKQEAASPVDTTAPAEPVKPVTPRKRRMAREPEAIASVIGASNAPDADPVADDTGPNKRGAAKVKAISSTDGEVTGSKAAKPTKAKGPAPKTIKAKAADPKPAVLFDAVPAPAGRSKARKSAAKTEAPAAQEA